MIVYFFIFNQTTLSCMAAPLRLTSVSTVCWSMEWRDNIFITFTLHPCLHNLHPLPHSQHPTWMVLSKNYLLMLVSLIIFYFFYFFLSFHIYVLYTLVFFFYSLYPNFNICKKECIHIMAFLKSIFTNKMRLPTVASVVFVILIFLSVLGFWRDIRLSSIKF